MTFKRLYLKLLLATCYNKHKYGQKITPIGRYFLKILPKLSVTWNNGIRYQPNYNNRRWVLRCFQGQHEPILEDFIIKILKKGDNVIDVGAQVGLISILLAKVTGSDGNVYALEPNPYNFSILNETIEINKVESITTFQKGAGKKTGKTWFAEKTLTGYSQQPNGSIKNNSDSDQVEIIAIDDLVESKCKIPISFIKVDVDGPDFDVIMGAKKLLGSSSPPLLCVECSHYWSNFGHTFKDARDFVESFGYRIFIAQRNQDSLIVLEENSRIPPGWGESPGQAFNFYCYHPDFHSERIQSFIGATL